MKRIPLQTQRAIIRDYIAKEKVAVIALQHRVSPWVVWRLARSAGVARKVGRPQRQQS